MSPSRFHVLPVREISDSRVTTLLTIHCCSVASSRQLFCSPFSSRISHCRSTSVGASFPPTAVVGASSLGSARSCGAGGLDELGRRVSRAVDAAPTFVFDRLRILN